MEKLKEKMWLHRSVETCLVFKEWSARRYNPAHLESGVQAECGCVQTVGCSDFI